MPTEFSNSSREMVSDQFLSHGFFTLLQAGKNKKQHHAQHSAASINTMPSPRVTTSTGKALSEPSYPAGNAGKKRNKSNDFNNCSRVSEANTLTDTDKVW